MSNRIKTMVATFAYLFLNSVMFGAIFSRPIDKNFIIIGLACGMVSQVLFIYILMLVYKTER